MMFLAIERKTYVGLLQGRLCDFFVGPGVKPRGFLESQDRRFLRKYGNDLLKPKGHGTKIYMFFRPCSIILF